MWRRRFLSARAWFFRVGIWVLLPCLLGLGFVAVIK